MFSLKDKLNFLNFWLSLGAIAFIACEMAVLLLTDGGTSGLVSTIWFSNFVLVSLSVFGWRGVLANRKKFNGKNILFYGNLIYALGPLLALQFTVMSSRYVVMMSVLAMAASLMGNSCLMDIFLSADSKKG